MYNHKDENTFRTSDIELAAYLIAKECNLEGAEKTNFKKTIFVFSESKKLQLNINRFRFNTESSSELYVNAKKLLSAHKHLKELINSDDYYVAS